VAVLHWTALVNCAVQQTVQLLLFMSTSVRSIKLKHKDLTGCSMWNALHATNGKYENL